ncbi:MAG: hypothetical protein LBV74_19840, partial [Tannerella sp.]|nr:hypothetical protein [Tannerella sp.]
GCRKKGAISHCQIRSDFYVWGEYHVLSADGSRLALPNHISVREEPWCETKSPRNLIQWLTKGYKEGLTERH